MKMENGNAVIETSGVTSVSDETEKSWPQVLTIIIACLAPLTNGLLLTWSSPFLLKITEDTDNYNITEEETSNFNTIHPIAFTLACTCAPKLCEKIGGKKTLLLVTISQVTAWVLSAVATDVYMFYAMRFCAGLSSGMAFSSLPTYIGEISTPRVRSTCGCLYSSAMQLGSLLVAVVGNYCSVRVTAFIFLTLPLIFCLLFAFMPDSPYYNAIRGKDEEAKKSLRSLKRKKDVERDFLQLKADISRQTSESGNWRDLNVIESNRRALVAGIFLRLSPSFGAYTVFFVYVQLIFEKSGSDVSSAIASIFYMGMSFALNILVILFIIHRIERKTCYIASTLPSGVVLILLSIYLFIDDNNENHTDLSMFKWVPITGMILYVIFASYGMAVIPTLMLGELFSASIKSKAISVILVAFGISIFASNYIFYFLYSNSGLHAPLLFFGCCNLVSTIISFYVIPETKDKTLEEIQQSMKRHKQIEVLE